MIFKKGLKMKTTMPIHMNSADGIEVLEFLKRKLDLPDNCIEVHVTLKANDLIQVDCKYYPSRDNIK